MLDLAYRAGNSLCFILAPRPVYRTAVADVFSRFPPLAGVMSDTADVAFLDAAAFFDGA